MELENEKLKYNIEYYKTDSYLRAARARESKPACTWREGHRGAKT
jgi:hypothetical protein